MRSWRGFEIPSIKGSFTVEIDVMLKDLERLVKSEQVVSSQVMKRKDVSSRG